jgi:hypothetical protein
MSSALACSTKRDCLCEGTIEQYGVMMAILWNKADDSGMLEMAR